MHVPSSITDLSQTAGSNSPAGTESPITADDYLRAYAAFIAMLRDGKGFSDPATLASAATTDIGAQASMFVKITGTTTITSFGSNYEGPRFIRFVGALTLTHNATTLSLPGGANITTEANDSCIAVPNATPNGWDVVHYQRNDLAPGVADSASTIAAGFVSTLTTVVLDASADYLVIGEASDSGNAKKALLPAATEALSGVVELATTAEAAAGTDTTRAVTAAGVKAAIDATGILGSGQTWQNMSASRTSGTTYTNSTGKPIVVSLYFTGSSVAITVGGVSLGTHASANGSTQTITSFIVPAGATYSVTYGGAPQWNELR